MMQTMTLTMTVTDPKTVLPDTRAQLEATLQHLLRGAAPDLSVRVITVTAHRTEEAPDD